MISMGVDYSTRRVGIAIINEKGELLVAKVESLERFRSHKRKRLWIAKLIRDLEKEYFVGIIVVEAVRLFSGRGIPRIQFETILRLQSVITTINDKVSSQMFAIETRSWKARIIPAKLRKGGKEVSVKYVKEKYGIDTVHDLADAICLAECEHNPRAKQMLKEVQ